MSSHIKKHHSRYCIKRYSLQGINVLLIEVILFSCVFYFTSYITQKEKAMWKKEGREWVELFNLCINLWKPILFIFLCSSTSCHPTPFLLFVLPPYLPGEKSVVPLRGLIRLWKRELPFLSFSTLFTRIGIFKFNLTYRETSLFSSLNIFFFAFSS